MLILRTSLNPICVSLQNSLPICRIPFLFWLLLELFGCRPESLLCWLTGPTRSFSELSPSITLMVNTSELWHLWMKQAERADFFGVWFSLKVVVLAKPVLTLQLQAAEQCACEWSQCILYLANKGLSSFLKEITQHPASLSMWITNRNGLLEMWLNS